MGLQPINVASSTQAHVLGTVIRARDVNYGEGEFVYLMGVASTAAGDAVCYNSKTGVTVRAVDGGSTSVGAVGIAMAATTAGLYGWYQISGSGPVNAATTAANTQAFLTSTAGQIDDTGSSTIAGLTISAATSAGFATVQLDRPAVNPSGGGGAISFASVGSTPNAAGGSASGLTLTLQPADATHPGVMTTGTQTVAGAKTFSSAVEVGGNLIVGNNVYANFNQVTLFGNAADGAAAIGVRIGAGPAYANAGAKLLSICDAIFSGGNVEKAFVSSNGSVELTTVGASFILKSPDGTRWKLAVADITGALTAVLA